MDDPASVPVGIGAVVLDVIGYLVDTRAAHGCPTPADARAECAGRRGNRGYISGRDPAKADPYVAGAFERLRNRHVHSGSRAPNTWGRAFRSPPRGVPRTKKPGRRAGSGHCALP